MGAPAEPQTAANHARYVLGFHIVTGACTVANLVWAVVRLAIRRDADSAATVLVAIILLQLFWYLRQFPLVVQDRVIRLEERLRLARLLPDDLQPRVDDFTRDQLVAMRFASDAELPGLAQRILAGQFTDRGSIKAAIREWRADDFRA